MPRATYFPKIEKFDTSLYMLGWGGAHRPMPKPRCTPRAAQPRRGRRRRLQLRRHVNDQVRRRWPPRPAKRPTRKREELIKAALQAHNEQVHHIPLHRQVIPWAMKAGITVPHSPANWLSVDWVQLPAK